MEETTMQTQTPKPAPILEVAWQRHANLDLAAGRRTRAFYSIRRWITLLGVLATLFAILSQQSFFSDTSTIAGFGIKVLFIAIPVLASIFAAFASKFYSNGSWLVYRACSEEI